MDDSSRSTQAKAQPQRSGQSPGSSDRGRSGANTMVAPPLQDASATLQEKYGSRSWFASFIEHLPEIAAKLDATSGESIKLTKHGSSIYVEGGPDVPRT